MFFKSKEFLFLIQVAVLIHTLTCVKYHHLFQYHIWWCKFQILIYSNYTNKRTNALKSRFNYYTSLYIKFFSISNSIIMIKSIQKNFEGLDLYDIIFFQMLMRI